MAEKDYAPLTASCVRLLNDKLYDKRKTGALEIEKLVRDLMSSKNATQIKKLLRILGQDFTLSQNPSSRKGGLIGLAAVAIALGKDAGSYVPDLVKPVLTCFTDSDSKIRYYACESLYNIVKVIRAAILPYFAEIFDGLSRLAADVDQNVRNGTELLDRLMKDIVSESINFDIASFIPMLRERIYTKSSFARQFILSWLTVLDSVPDINMTIYLPEILDGVFQILSDSNAEIRKMCETLLAEMLLNISKQPDTADYSSMTNVLVFHSQSSECLLQYTAIMWLRDFIQLSGRTMLPFASGILTAVLPCLSFENQSWKQMVEVAKVTNLSLQRLVTESDNKLSPSDEQPSTKIGDIVETGATTNDNKPPQPTPLPMRLNIPSVVHVLVQNLQHEATTTRVASLRWIYHLFMKIPDKIFQHVDELFPVLLKLVSDASDEVVLVDLEVIAEISSSEAGQRYPPQKNDCVVSVLEAVKCSHGLNDYFAHFMVHLLALFHKDAVLMEDRSSFIIRQLCLLLSADDVYRCCAEILLLEADLKFAAGMIRILSTNLLTSTELYELRSLLKELKSKESCTLFCSLYRAWCHSPVSTVSLCLLAQMYEHTADLLTAFGDLEVTVDFLSEIDKLVQLIESPIFTYLRLQLLDIQHNGALVKSLYSLLMLLPQSDTFRILQHRLQCIPHLHFPVGQSAAAVAGNQPIKSQDAIPFADLLKHFVQVQHKHRQSRKVQKSAAIDSGSDR